MGEHVVPAELALDELVEPGVDLGLDDLGPCLAVLGDDFVALVPADEVVLLVALQVREGVLGPVM